MCPARCRARLRVPFPTHRGSWGAVCRGQAGQRGVTGAWCSCAYFPSRDFLLKNSIQRALAKPNLVLEAILHTGKGRKLKINQPPLLLSGNFLSWQEPATPLLPRGGNRSGLEHKTTVA